MASSAVCITPAKEHGLGYGCFEWIKVVKNNIKKSRVVKEGIERKSKDKRGLNRKSKEFRRIRIKRERREDKV